ncbi:MAG: hypothetical protein JO043_06605 [Candidatus Eremiobacteraeota bacterium]|nr:hypothetical protein [Candidatus Eremiobacteraeota bacterium]
MLVYPQNDGPMQNQCGQLTTDLMSPQGLATDRVGNVYVTNSGSSAVPPSIVKFRPQSQNPELKISDAGEFPVGIAIGDNGDIVVANEISQPGSGPGNVIVFDRHGKLITTLSDPNAKYEIYPAVDEKGDIFTTYLDANSVGHVNEFIHGKVRELPITLQFPGNLRFDGRNLLVLDAQANTLSTYPPPYKSASNVESLPNSGFPSDFDLTSSGKALYVTEGEFANVHAYTYPGGARINTLDPPSGGIAAVAMWPDHAP